MVTTRRRYLIALCIAFIVGIVLLPWLAHSEPIRKPWKEYQEPQQEISLDAKRRLRNPLMFKSEAHQPSSVFGNSSLYVMIVPSSRLWSHVPTLLQTVLTQYPKKTVFSDTGAVVGDTRVIDAIAKIRDDTAEDDDDMAYYRLRRFGIDQDWGWSPEEYWSSNSEKLMGLRNEQALIEAKESLDEEVEWVIIADEVSYVSRHAFDAATKIENTEFISRTNSILVLSRSTFDQYVTTGSLPKMKTVAAGNISSTTLSKSNWCEPILAYTELQRWEMQTLFGRETKQQRSPDDHLSSGFYRDFIMPYIAAEKDNWVIFPNGPVYSHHLEDGSELTKALCKELCENKEECLAWQWSSSLECRLETEGIRRGIAKNPLHKEFRSQEPSMTSGWMIDRIRQIRLAAPCDPLAVDADGHFNDESGASEGWMKAIRDQLKVEGSEVLMSLKSYEEELANSS